LACPTRPWILSQTVRPDLGLLLADALQDVQNLFFKHAVFATTARKQSVKDYGLSLPTLVTYSVNDRVVELDELTLRLNQLLAEPARGLYFPDLGRIFLVTGKWCYKTLLHETLHSLSTFQDVRYRNFADGVTEFLVGYVLWKKYSVCHQDWLSNLESPCALGRAKGLRLWHAFCRFVKPSVLVSLYFFDNGHDWKGKWLRFLQNIRSEGYRVSDVLGQYPTTLEDDFKNECDRRIAGFSAFYENEACKFDYSLLPPI
jgi:hypothetical protein